MDNLRVALTGASGVGKTTIANEIARIYGIPFMSSSMSDIVLDTKLKPQSELISNATQVNEVNLLSARAKMYAEHVNFVTDRSPIDSIAYYIHKLSTKVSISSIDVFRGMANKALENITHLIYIDYDATMIQTWPIQDNGKRVKNSYFQWMMGMVIKGVLTEMYSLDYIYEDEGGSLWGMLRVGNRLIPTLILMGDTDLKRRMNVIQSFIDENR